MARSGSPEAQALVLLDLEFLVRPEVQDHQHDAARVLETLDHSGHHVLGWRAAGIDRPHRICADDEGDPLPFGGGSATGLYRKDSMAGLDTDDAIPRLGDLPLENVVEANELCDEARPGLLIDLRGSCDLFESPCVHDRDTIRHDEGLTLVVGHVDERDPHLTLQRLEFALHLDPKPGVQRTERLVEEDEGGPPDQCPRPRPALLLAPGQLLRSASG